MSHDRDICIQENVWSAAHVPGEAELREVTEAVEHATINSVEKSNAGADVGLDELLTNSDGTMNSWLLRLLSTC